jgi:two-component system response regulator AtoC
MSPPVAASAHAGTVYFVDDDPEMCAVVDVELSDLGFTVRTFTAADGLLDALRTDDPDVIVTDLRMRKMNGLELCERIVNNRRDVPVVVVTAFGSMDLAIGAMRVGAYDFITKPFGMEALAVSLRRAIEKRRLGLEVLRLRATTEALRGNTELVGDSPAMRQVYDLVQRFVTTEAPVLITGESGTGKELLARLLHKSGRRAAGPFVAINCAAVPEGLLESELFGHTRGSFTSAHEGRPGLFQEASGGTLFLDEIGEMPPAMQAKLLRALQERMVRPVGSAKEVPYDARVLAATHRDLESAVAEGRFREDLYWRINVLHVELPPLSARGGDVLLLAQRFIDTAARGAGKAIEGLTPEAARKLLEYAWPGNVRELQNCVERAVALASFSRITVEDLPERVRSYSRHDVVVASEDPSELVTLEEVERRYVKKVMEAVNGNKVHAARILGIDRTTLYRKLGK